MEGTDTGESGHIFKFGHSGFIGHPTPEQEAILDRLKAGELTPEQAAGQLGGKVHEGGFELHWPPCAEAETAERVAPTPLVARAVEVCRFALPLVLAILALVGGLVWVRGDLAVRNHVFITVLVAGAAFVGVFALAGPQGIARFTRAGQTTGRVAFVGASAGAAAMLGWGIAVTVAGHWSLFVPGVVAIALATGVLVAALLTFEAVAGTRELVDDLHRRR